MQSCIHSKLVDVAVVLFQLNKTKLISPVRSELTARLVDLVLLGEGHVVAWSIDYLRLTGDDPAGWRVALSIRGRAEDLESARYGRVHARKSKGSGVQCWMRSKWTGGAPVLYFGVVTGEASLGHLAKWAWLAQGRALQSEQPPTYTKQFVILHFIQHIHTFSSLSLIQYQKRLTQLC